MSKKFLMGNEAIALGAIHAGVNLVAGYPGTPSTEILESAAKFNDGSIYVEWSVNEKAALEVAAGASYAGARTLVTMKQVGLNVASDPLMSLAYIGIEGGMVIAVADDPGPISSQTEQDTRHFAQFAKLPVFDPSSPDEAYSMIRLAFEYSEKYKTPVIFRPTTRVCHGCASIETDEESAKKNIPAGFAKNTLRWVVFPKTSYLNHIKLEQRYPVLSDDFSSLSCNSLEGAGEKAIACGGVSYSYVKEALCALNENPTLLKITTPYPFPEKKALEMLCRCKEVLVLEELDPVIERELIYLCGKHGLSVTVHGKLDGFAPPAGEGSADSACSAISSYLSINAPVRTERPVPPMLPIRPPVLCAGCPHRASFYAVKQAMKGKKAVFSGDIGCYTLGNAMPLDMVDTCLCMGADVTIAQGLHRIEPDTVNFSFIGDSTFFASGITGVINAVYNQTDIILIVLDNSTTAMTGHQPHPGTGKTMMGNYSEKISIEALLDAIGVSSVEVVNPLDLVSSVDAVKRAADTAGVRAIIFRRPCIAVSKSSSASVINTDKCKNCKKCIKEIGCPAIVASDGTVRIEASLCFGCGLCSQICPFEAIEKGGE